MLIYSLSQTNAGVAELADALDLGSSVTDVGVQVLSPAPKKRKNGLVYVLCHSFLYYYKNEEELIMSYTYNTKGTCSSKIEFDVEDGIVKNVRFTGGCNGNLKAISALVEGQPKEKVIKLLKGIKCGYKETSCGDQLARALEEVK